MDIAAYISDLLKQYGELTIPGLGRFARMRVNGYYNEEEEIMYPPSYHLSFNPDFQLADDTIANRISFVKNISLTSSQYFLDKFVTGIKEDVAKGDVAFADLGYFHQDQNGRLHFTFNNDELTRDEGFFGFAPLKIRKLVKAASIVEAVPPRVVEPPTTVVEPLAPVRYEPVSTYKAPEYNFEPVASQTEEPVAEEPTPLPPVKEKKLLSFNDIFARKKQEQEPEPEPVGETESLTPETEVFQNRPADTDDFITEEKEARSGVSVWIILAAVVVVAGAALFGLYKYDPSAFAKLNQWRSKPAAPVTKPSGDTTAETYTVKPDTTKINPDSAAQSNPATVAKTETLATNTKGTEEKTDTPTNAPVKTKSEPVAVTKKTTVPTTTAATHKPVAKPAAPVAESAPASTTATAGNVDANGNEIVPGITPHHYEVYGVSTHNIKEAERALRNYKSLGFPGHLIQNHNKTHFRVSLGTYNTYKEAREAFNKMIATKKVSEIDLSVEPYTYKIK